MSNESENEDFEEMMEVVRETTQIINTPDPENEGKFWLYSIGMKDNHELPDLEIHDVPGMFTGAAASTINTINAYRLTADSNPLEVGHTMQWKYGDIRVEQGQDWDGRASWDAEDMLRLVSRLTDVECCVGCECKEAGVTE